MSGVLSLLARVWRWLVDPAVVIAEQERRHQVRLLSTVLVGVMGVSVLYTLLYLLLAPRPLAIAALLLSAMALLVPAHWFARRGRIFVAMLTTCAVVSLLCYAALLTDLSVIAYSLLLVPILLAGALLSMPMALVVTGTLLAGGAAVLLFAPFPQDIGDAAWLPTMELLVVSLLGGLALFTYAHRNKVAEARRARLSEEEATWHALAENALDGILVYQDNGIVYLNQRAAELVGYEREEVLHLAPEQFFAPGVYELVMKRYRDRMAGKPVPRQYEIELLDRQGARVAVEITAARTTWHGSPAGLAIVRDVSERRRVDARVRTLSRAIEQTGDAVMVTNRDGVIEYVNPAFQSISGYTEAEILGKRPQMFRSGKHGAEFYRRLWDTLLQGKPFSEIFTNLRKDGSVYYEHQTITPIRDDAGSITYFVSTGRDVTDQMRVQNRLNFLAHHDALTHMPNRTLFVERLQRAIAFARRNNRRLAVMFLDLDRFKHINDSLGHDFGDSLLCAFGKRVQHVLRETDTFARFGGDEFAILLSDVADPSNVIQIAEKILERLEQPFQIEEHELFVTTSIGISLYPSDAQEVPALMKYADIAMYHAKDAGRNNFRFYSSEMSRKAERRLSMENELRRALERKEFVLHYQPFVSLADGRVRGAEALVRWQHPVRGLLAPQEFIPLLEETGLINNVGTWILRTACAQAARWQAPARGGPLRMCVNLSGRQLNDTALPRVIEDIMADTGLSPDLLELEITESVFMHNLDTAATVLNALREMGVRVAIDDFGTGYSSLYYLKHLPIHTLKIDGSFLRAVTEDRDNAAIVKSVIALAHNMEIAVVAEGVESMRQWNFLREQQCGLGQGYLIAQAQPAEKFIWSGGDAVIPEESGIVEMN